MKVPATALGKSSLCAMLVGQAILLAALVIWSPLVRGVEWATRTLVISLAGSGAGLYFAGRIMQLVANRRRDKQQDKS